MYTPKVCLLAVSTHQISTNQKKSSGSRNSFHPSTLLCVEKFADFKGEIILQVRPKMVEISLENSLSAAKCVKAPWTATRELTDSAATRRFRGDHLTIIERCAFHLLRNWRPWTGCGRSITGTRVLRHVPVTPPWD